MNKISYAGIAALLAAALMAQVSSASAADQNRNRERDRSSFSNSERLNKLLGSEVVASDGEKVGKLNNLALDLESGHVLFAIVGTGLGGTGIAGDKVAVPPGVFTDTSGDKARMNITREQFKKAPKITNEMMDREHLAQASFVNQVYGAFNKSAWWKGSTPADQGTFHNVHAGEKLIGMKVNNVMDKHVGEVRNALIDLPSGRIVWVAMEPANDLDLGNKLYALPPNAFTLGKDGKSLVSDVDRSKLSNGPSFTRDDWTTVRDRAFASKVYSHYGKQAYFEAGSGSDLQPTGR